MFTLGEYTRFGDRVLYWDGIKIGTIPQRLDFEITRELDSPQTMTEYRKRLDNTLTEYASERLRADTLQRENDSLSQQCSYLRQELFELKQAMQPSIEV